jgi:four helix bundle protein
MGVLSFCRRAHSPDDARLQAHAQHSGMHDFRRLNVWQLARELGAEIYRETASASRPELRLITSQLRRSALSIAANIAEGCGKSSRAETIRFLEIAAGSAAETEHHLLVARDIGILTTRQAERLLSKIGSVRRMLRALTLRLPQEPDSPRATPVASRKE